MYIFYQVNTFKVVATFLNVAGTKLGFWTFAKVFDEKRQVLEFFVYFQSKFLSKTTK